MNYWLQSNNDTYRLVKAESIIKDVLPLGIYIPDYNHDDNFWFLTKQKYNKFNLPEEILHSEENDSFIKRVLHTTKSLNKNVGVLLNGLKGSGKSITLKRLANELAETHPIIVLEPNAILKEKGLELYLNNFSQDIVVIIDEFEKCYNEVNNRYETPGRVTDLLTLMDGLNNSTFQKIFLLTSNSLDINKNLISRPSRIRYLKTYTGLSEPEIDEILNKKLNPKFIFSVREYLLSVKFLTIDIVLSLIEEVNLHERFDDKFEEEFNIELYKVPVVNAFSKDKTVMFENIKIEYISWTHLDRFYMNLFSDLKEIGYLTFLNTANDQEQYSVNITQVINKNHVKCNISKVIIDPDTGENTHVTLSEEDKKRFTQVDLYFSVI